MYLSFGVKLVLLLIKFQVFKYINEIAVIILIIAHS